MGYLSDFLDHVGESFAGLFNLEADPELTERQNVEKVIDQTGTVACIVSMILPIPAADFLALTPLQAKMTFHIARIKGFQLSEERAREVVKEIVGVLGLSLTAHLLIVSVSKFIPFGGLLTVPLIYAATWAIGNVVDYYFDCLRSGNEPSAAAMKALFAEQFRVGKRRGEQLDEGDLKRKAEELRRKVEAKDPSLRTETRFEPPPPSRAAGAPTASPGEAAARAKIKITPREANSGSGSRKTIGADSDELRAVTDPPADGAAPSPAPAAQAPGAPAAGSAPAPRPASGGERLIDQLERLAKLHAAGVLDADEFEQAKRRLLA